MTSERIPRSSILITIWGAGATSREISRINSLYLLQTIKVPIGGKKQSDSLTLHYRKVKSVAGGKPCVLEPRARGEEEYFGLETEATP